MKIRSFFLLSAMLVLPATTQAAPPEVGPAQPAAPITRAKVTTKLAVADATFAMGESGDLAATLTTGDGKGLSKRKISATIFTLPNKNLVGSLSGETDDDGKAKIAFRAVVANAGVELLIRTKFGGDALFTESTVDSSVKLVKAKVKIDLTEARKLPNQGPMVNVTLRRDTDNKELTDPMNVFINGKMAKLSGQTSYNVVLIPQTATKWEVKAEFAGNEDLFPNTVTKTFGR